MNHHNLDDLIIDNIDPKNSKMKGILTIIALIIVILIVAIILTKIILKDPNTQRIALEENNTELISPELTLQHAVETEESKKSTVLDIPAKEEPKKDEISLSAQEISSPEQESDASTENRSIQSEQKAEIVSKIVEPDEEVSEYTAAETIEEKPEETSPQKITAPAKITEKAVAQPAQEEPVKIPTPSSQPTVSSQYYIQVGSFRSMPSAQFLSVIKNSGFEYHIVPEPLNNTKKLLIGPYTNRSEADAAIVRVKDRINKSAFVIKK
ncbi:MAG: SPOR domain-containing protein [Sulfurovum sp.]|jgi:cell division protein FtsN|nr:SPOR domain-containing protein [Sulfurovum sp.]